MSTEDSTSNDTATDQPHGNVPDSYTQEEIRLLLDASMDNDDGPCYRCVSPAERHRFDTLVADVVDKPVDEVLPTDWYFLDGSWELPALLHTGAETGLSPAELADLRVDCLQLDNCTIRVSGGEVIYKRHSGHQVAITETTAQILRWWLQERRCHDRYQDTDLLFVDSQGRSLTSSSLNNRLTEATAGANIDTTDRTLVWSSLRQTLGTLPSELAD